MNKMEISDAIKRLESLTKSILCNCSINDIEQILMNTDALMMAIEVLKVTEKYKDIPATVVEIQMYNEMLQPFCNSIPIFNTYLFKDIKFIGLDDDIELKPNQCKYIYSDGNAKIYNLFEYK